MKRCPHCRRDYYDETLVYCLDDGTSLVDGPARPPTADEAKTVILNAERPTSEARTRINAVAGMETGGRQDPTNDLPTPDTALGTPGTKARAWIAVIAVLAAVGVGLVMGYRYLNPAVTNDQITSIAVMPFENRSGSADADYLSDGLADSLIYRLSQLPGLKVSPTTSVMRYKNSPADLTEIAKELDVSAVLSGRVLQHGDRLSISVQLVDARTKNLLWAEQYDRRLADLLVTQREIASSIAEKLKLRLVGEQARGITKKYTQSSEAYQLYLKGQFYFAKRTPEDFKRGIASFEEATKLDPDFALAYARIAEAYNQISAYAIMRPNDAFPKAKAAAVRALEIDPTLAEGHTFLGQTQAIYDWDWPAAELSFKRGLELDPNSVSARFRYGQLYLAPLGRTDEAIEEIKKALDAEPLDLNMRGNLAMIYILAREYDLAADQSKRTFDLQPTFVTARFNLCQAYVMKGMFDEAIALGEDWLRVDPRSQFILQPTGVAYARSNRREEAEAVIARFRSLGEDQYVNNYWIATIYAALGDADSAFAELERAVEEHDWHLIRLKTDPFMDPLRHDRRMASFLRRVNLPE